MGRKKRYGFAPREKNMLAVQIENISLEVKQKDDRETLILKSPRLLTTTPAEVKDAYSYWLIQNSEWANKAIYESDIDEKFPSRTDPNPMRQHTREEERYQEEVIERSKESNPEHRLAEENVVKAQVLKKCVEHLETLFKWCAYQGASLKEEVKMLEILFHNQPVTRDEFAEKLHDAGLVTGNTNERYRTMKNLIRKGFVQEKKHKRPHERGRPPKLLMINEDFFSRTCPDVFPEHLFISLNFIHPENPRRIRIPETVVYPQYGQHTNALIIS